LSSPDIFLSHDWPQSIEQHGSVRDLLRRKPFFRADVDSGRLGSPPLMGLLRTLKPRWWFSAHLHVRFEATVVHDRPGELGAPPDKAGTSSEAVSPVLPPQPSPATSMGSRNPDEIAIDVDDEFVEGVEVGPGPMAQDDHASTSEALGGVLSNVSLDSPQTVSARVSGANTRSETKFLALDKCLPKRTFLEVKSVSLIG
jgi:lariat debranching enzyme